MLKKYLFIIILSLSMAIGVQANIHQEKQLSNQGEIASDVIKIKMPKVNIIAKNENATQVFMELDNIGQKTHKLIAAYSPAAQRVQIHKTLQKNKEHYMAQVPNINIPAHHEQNLQSGGFHIMLMGLNTSIKEGKKIPIVLIFEDGSYIRLEVPVV